MIDYFDESTDQGKLFLNYPMMQSYKDFSQLPDDIFKDRVVDINECRDYKELVGLRSRFIDISKYDHQLFVSLAVHHIKKANCLLTGEFELPLTDEYVTWSGASIYGCQIQRLHEYGTIFVLNTCLFILIDFAPNRFFRYVQIHNSELLI